MDRVFSPLDLTASIIEEYEDFVVSENHPCIMAQTVFAQQEYEFSIQGKLGFKRSAKTLLEDLENFIEEYDFSDNRFKSFVAVFHETEVATEIEFENLLWRQLQLMHHIDNKSWDHRVSDEPNNKNFSFSLGGRAFFVVGLHPKSSRMSRRAPYPTLVFNLHWQFEKLREMGVYERVRNKIRKRDAELQGSINPMLADYGESSEALQYSGRHVDKKWKCPFHSKK